MRLGHVMIRASAGSGKTYALTNRFVGLLAAGAKPERIVALTFTRKAAGEFFDEILRKLARAAEEDVFAAKLAAELGRPELGRRDFLRLLREMVDAMHRLRLGTLDGFFGRIARAFPLELGLAGEFEVLHEHAARSERRRVLQRIFARLPGGLDAAQREFIEAFKRATFGVEEKRLGARLDAFLDDHQETFLAAAGTGCWGNPERIWPGGCEWLLPQDRTLVEAVDSLRRALQRRGLPEKQWQRWEIFFAALPEWVAGAPLPRAIEYILENSLEVWPDLRRGSAEVRVERKKMALGPEECRDLATIIRHLVCAELTSRLETTRGIHAVLQGYDAVYHDVVRRSGKLTFGDVQRLLQPRDGAEAAVDRMEIDFRLDAQFDHWLLDEFQDTSFGQWSVLRNLVDEVIQDATGARTFFCVGDVKQAIFTWREGDPRLFREILEHYNEQAPGTIVEEQLVASWRSGPAIIEMVNAVFGRADVLSTLFPGDASATWSREWLAHVSARPQLASHAAWLHAADERERFERTVALIHEIAPLERGLSCAVLTQTNATATLLAEFLRQEGGIPALAESDLHVCTDNPVGAALLALAQAAAHPGDTLAWEHVQMTPLRDVLAAADVKAPEGLTRTVLGQVHAHGFERTMEFWLKRLEPKLEEADLFSRERGRQFVTAAGVFDATGSRDVAEFVAFMQRHTVRDAESPGVVRVMTIHKSKGLGFDVVLLPDLEGQRIDQRRGGLAVQRTRERVVDWVLELPPKLFHAQDETLAGHVRAAEADACYEALALLYVAMTRAKRAMYLITKPPGTSESRNYPKLVASTLGAESATVSVGQLRLAGGWSVGQPDWHAALTATEELPAAEKSARIARFVGVPRNRRMTRRLAQRPSAQGHERIAAAQLLAAEGGRARDFGSAVHRLLATVKWSCAADVDTRVRAWMDAGAEPDAVETAAKCLRATELSDIWREPEAEAEVWRERAFEVVLEDAWVTGVFDRVIVERADGRVRRVRVFDFKTDQLTEGASLETATQRHAAQLNVYRRVAAVFAAVSPAQVECEVVFTHGPRRVVIPAK